MQLEDLGTSWGSVGLVVVAGAVAYALVIALTRLAGVRSLATMSAFDFAATVAVGSTFSAVLLGSAPLAAGAVGLVLLFGLQYAVASLRRRGLLLGLVDNRPLLLVSRGRVLQESLSHTRLSEDELWSQLRQAGVRKLSQVHAAVFETSGTVSVLPEGERVDARLLRGVRGVDQP